MYHPNYPKDLYIVKDSLTKSGNYFLQPLCYKAKKNAEVCQKEKQDCCNNGDCVNNQCSCYAGYLASKNCCCKEISKYTLKWYQMWSFWVKLYWRF